MQQRSVEELKDMALTLKVPLDMLQAVIELFSGNRDSGLNDHAEKFITWLMEACSITSSTYDDNPRMMAYLEGRRDVGMQILKMTGLAYTRLEKIRAVQWDSIDAQEKARSLQQD